MHEAYMNPNSGRVNFGQSHFDAADEGWTLMGTEEGWRTFQKPVPFLTERESPPEIFLSLVGVDFLNLANARLSITAKNVTTTGFVLEVATWADSQVWGCGVQWMAR